MNLKEKSHVSVVIYGITWEKISVVENAVYETGTHNITYNTDDDLNEGVYFIEYLIGNERKVSKLVKH